MPRPPSALALVIAALAPALGAPTVVRAQAQEAVLRGTVVAAAGGQPLPGATVAVRRAAAGAPGGTAPTDTALAGAATARADGTFRVDGLPPGRYTVRVRALGYAPLVRTPVVVAAGGAPVELGRLALASVATQLGRVQVAGERDATALAPDRNSFNARALSSAAGGTAIDVLRNVPQVEVDGDNNVSLRGNANVVVQINGRPTPLRGQQLGNYLAQLPANLVAKVDVATNPSAKNDPDGAAGLINIVLSQRTDLGTSGGVSASTATTGLANLSGNLGRQQGRWTGFASYGFFRDARPLTGSSDRFDPTGLGPAALRSTIDGRMRPLSHNVTARGEVKLGKVHTLAADAVVNAGVFRRANDAFYRAFGVAGDTTARFAQLSDGRSRNVTGDYALAYRRTVDPVKNALSVELRLNDADNGFRNVLTQQALTLAGAVDPAAPVVPPSRDVTDGRTPTWRAQADWTRALAAHTKLETGVLGIRRRTASDFERAALLPGGAEQVDLAHSNAFTYRERVASAYGVLSQKVGKFDLQGGLRLEGATTRFDLAPNRATPNVAASALTTPGTPAAGAAGQRFGNQYRSVFPSGLVAYNLDPKRQLKASYSRRISRPDPQQLNPFAFREDALNVFQGNPALRPEYTDAYELGYQHTLPKGSVQLTPYYRRTPGAVRFLRTVDTAGVTRSSFANVALSESYGTDLNVTARTGRLTLFGGGSVFRQATNARNITPDVSFRATGWSARGNATVTLSPLYDLQGFAMYRAPMATEGGRQDKFAMTNVALKRKLKGDAATLTLRASDPFNTMAWGLRTTSGQVVQVTDRHFGARSLGLSFNYTFGKPPKFRPPRADEGGQPQGVPGGGPPG